MTGNSATGNELPIFIHWMDFLDWLFATTEKFPHKARFTFASRIDNLALDIVEDLVEARYSKDRQPILKRANLRLEKMRVLVRLSHKRHFLSHTSYEYAARQINETGRMLGGWRKEDK